MITRVTQCVPCIGVCQKGTLAVRDPKFSSVYSPAEKTGMYSTSQLGPLLRLMPQDRCDVRDWELGAIGCTFPTMNAQKEYPETRGCRYVN